MWTSSLSLGNFYFMLKPISGNARRKLLTLKVVNSDTKIIVSLLLPRFNSLLDTVSKNLKCCDVIDECFLTVDDIS